GRDRLRPPARLPLSAAARPRARRYGAPAGLAGWATSVFDLLPAPSMAATAIPNVVSVPKRTQGCAPMVPPVVPVIVAPPLANANSWTPTNPEGAKLPVVEIRPADRSPSGSV